MRRKCERRQRVENRSLQGVKERAAVKRTAEVGTFLLSLHVPVRERQGGGKDTAPVDLKIYPNNLLNMDRA